MIKWFPWHFSSNCPWTIVNVGPFYYYFCKKKSYTFHIVRYIQALKAWKYSTTLRVSYIVKASLNRNSRHTLPIANQAPTQLVIQCIKVLSALQMQIMLTYDLDCFQRCITCTPSERYYSPAQQGSGTTTTVKCTQCVESRFIFGHHWTHTHTQKILLQIRSLHMQTSPVVNRQQKQYTHSADK